jgi:hypothetical protein
MAEPTSPTSSLLLQRVKQRKAEAELAQQVAEATAAASEAGAAATATAYVNPIEERAVTPESHRAPTGSGNDVFEGRVVWRDPFARDRKEVSAQPT